MSYGYRGQEDRIEEEREANGEECIDGAFIRSKYGLYERLYQAGRRLRIDMYGDFRAALPMRSVLETFDSPKLWPRKSKAGIEF